MMQADIAQIIKAGWSSGKSSDDVAAEILRELDVPATLAATPAAEEKFTLNTPMPQFSNQRPAGEAATPAEADDISRYIANAHAQDAEISASETEFMVELKKRAATPAVSGEREVLASISRAVYRIREWAKGEGPYSEFIKEAAIIERRIEQIALTQPASSLRGRDLDVLKAYEQWEADFIMENKCREDREIPQLTGELWDRLLELQAMRNRALSASTPGTSRPDLGMGQEWRLMIIAPKDAEIIGQDTDGRIFNLRWEPDDSGENWYDIHGDQIAYPVRWMPLPAPPLRT